MIKSEFEFLINFQVGEEFEETTADGREVTAKVVVDGNKFISEQKAKKAGQKSTKVNIKILVIFVKTTLFAFFIQGVTLVT